MTTPAAFSAYISSFPASLQETIKSHYPFPSSTSEDSPINYLTTPASLLLRDQLFVNPAYDLVKTITSTVNSKSGKKVNAWFYRCRATIEVLSRNKVDLGAMYVFLFPFPVPCLSLTSNKTH